MTGGALVFYFNDAPTLFNQIIHGQITSGVLGWILALTFTTYLMAGFAREQVCIYMCPYSRFQSAMFDKETLVIIYDEKRGEPRGKHKAGESWEGKGHCIDCDSCVVVCPTGIDIRNGLQIECIACGMCVDACNNVMDKLGLPRGLVRYDTEHDKEIGAKPHLRFFRMRTLWYVSILSAVGGFMLYSLLTRAPFDINIMHDRNPLAVITSKGEIRNGYSLHILNRNHASKKFTLEVRGIENAKVKVLGASNEELAEMPVFNDSVGDFRVFVTAPKQEEVRKDISFEVRDVANGSIDTKKTLFISETK